MKNFQQEAAEIIEDLGTCGLQATDFDLRETGEGHAIPSAKIEDLVAAMKAKGYALISHEIEPGRRWLAKEASASASLCIIDAGESSLLWIIEG